MYQTLKHFEIVSLYTFGPYEHCFQLRAYLWFMLKECQPAFFSHHVEWKFQTRNCFNILLTIVKNASQCNLTFGVEHMINYSFSANGKVGYISRHVGHIWSQPMAKENIFHLSVTRHTATWAFPCQVYLLIIILIIILALLNAFNERILIIVAKLYLNIVKRFKTPAKKNYV